MAELIIKLGGGGSRRHKLTAVPHLIGREQSCDVFIDDPGTSRRHTRITPAGGAFVVEDLGSKNGTLVNGLAVTSQTLVDGDIITVGSVEMEFSDTSDAPSRSVVVTEDHKSTDLATTYTSRNRELLLSQRRLEMIYELSERLNTLRHDLGALLEDALAICFETLGFERGAVALRRKGDRGVDWPVVRNLESSDGELTISGSLLRRALERGERAIFTETEDGEFDPTVSMVQLGIRSAMCVPLMQENEVLGVIYGDQTRSSSSYVQEDIDFLAGIARQVSIGIVNHRLVEEQKRLVRFQHDIDLARKIQIELFPPEVPARGNFKAAGLNDPGNRVSGDYYDVVELDDGRVWLLIADVTGEGVAAALLMANLQAAARVTLRQSDDPGALLESWNDLICSNTDSSKFITCLLALVDPRCRSVHIASAGHPIPLILQAGGGRLFDYSVDANYPLGVVDGAKFTSDVIEPGFGQFLLVGFTDGVTEAMNPDHEQFGSDRMVEALVAAGSLEPQALVGRLRKAVSRFAAGAPQSDDITLLAARVG